MTFTPEKSDEYVNERACSNLEESHVLRQASVRKCINTIRTLALDTVNNANSGHPGAPMGMAPVTHVLLSRYAFSPNQ